MSAFRRAGRWTIAHFRLANRIVGNPEGAAGLELTLRGPTLRFNLDTVIALTGARDERRHSMACRAPYDQPIRVARARR